MKIGNCYLTYSPFLREHLVSTECKKPETAIKRFTAVLCELTSYNPRFDFSSLVRAVFSSSDVRTFDDGSFRKSFSCTSSGLLFDTTVFLELTFHDGVYILSVNFSSFDKTSDTIEDTTDTIL